MMPRARNPACTNLAETERLFRSIPRRPEPEGRRRPTKFTSPCWTRADFAIEIEKASNRQFHAKLFALAVAQDRQVNDFTFLSVFDRLSKIGDISFRTSFDSIL
jgi:hypothetical protein